jgi:hypothetical protein
MKPTGVVAAVLAVVLLVVGLPTLLFATKTTPQDKICVSYGGGPFEGKDFQGVHQPGESRFVNGIGDKLYCYPVTERSFIITSQPGASDSTTPIIAPSQDNIPLTFELATYFQLNIDKVADFHKAIGIKTRAFSDEGWVQMLNEYFKPQIDQAVQRLSRQYEATTAYADRGAFLTIQTELKDELPVSINDALGDDYFSDFRVVLRRIDVPDTLRQELLANKESAVRVETKANEVKQAEQEAQAIQKRQQALQGCQVCILYEAIKAGSIDFWVIPSGNELTLQTPTRD